MAFLQNFTQNVRRRVAAVRQGVSDSVQDHREGSRWIKWMAAGLGVYLILGLIAAMFWSAEPDTFDVREITQARVGENTTPVTGATITSTFIQVAETLLDKRGGYITNDMLFPGVWMDNMPNWEFGVLIQVRDMARAMRQSFSRSQSQSREDPFLAKAEPQFNFNNDNWIVPPTESEYRQGIEELELYLEGLSNRQASSTQFYARADNLRLWLQTVESRLGDLSQKLSASVGPRRLNTDLAGDPDAQQATDAPEELQVKTPWNEIDDVFYQARGSTWALIHFLKACEIDFAAVLAKKNATVSLRQIIRELESTQKTLWSPVILNGDGFGMLANHSLVMASYISRANAGLSDLRELLAQG